MAYSPTNHSISLAPALLLISGETTQDLGFSDGLYPGFLRRGGALRGCHGEQKKMEEKGELML
jgi:hypothetical protein